MKYIKEESEMNIQSIQNTRSIKNNASFGSIKIARTFGDVFALTIKADAQKDVVNFTDYKEGIKWNNFGKSMSAKALTEMMETLNEKVLSSENLNRVRKLASNVVDDMLPRLRDEHKIGEKIYTFCEKNNLKNLRASIEKGTANYSDAKNSLRLMLNPEEKVTTTIEVSRRALSDLGVGQP